MILRLMPSTCTHKAVDKHWAREKQSVEAQLAVWWKLGCKSVASGTGYKTHCLQWSVISAGEGLRETQIELVLGNQSGNGSGKV